MLGGRRPRSQPAWMETMLSEFDLSASRRSRSRKCCPGLSMREVREPDIFQIFFG